MSVKELLLTMTKDECSTAVEALKNVFFLTEDDYKLIEAVLSVHEQFKLSNKQLVLLMKLYSSLESTKEI